MFTLESLRFLMLGSLLGFSAGISPGPLSTLVITQTIRHNRTEGIKIALSPLVTDLPIILVTVLVFMKLSQFNTILAAISFAGSAFVAYLGYESFLAKGIVQENTELKTQSFRKGIITNFLSPNPYLFWATIGTPYAFRAFEIHAFVAAMFFVSFYLLLIGSKIAIALVVARTKEYIGQGAYRVIMRVLGVALFAFSIMFLYDGIQYLASAR